LRVLIPSRKNVALRQESEHICLMKLLLKLGLAVAYGLAILVLL
jgi:hypothetical protein